MTLFTAMFVSKVDAAEWYALTQAWRVHSWFEQAQWDAWER